MKYDLDSYHVLTEVYKGQFLNIGMNSLCFGSHYSYILSKCQTKKVQERNTNQHLLFTYRFINFKCFVFLMCAENEVLHINMYQNALGVKTGTH